MTYILENHYKRVDFMAAICYLRKLHQLLPWTAESCLFTDPHSKQTAKQRLLLDETNEWSLKAEGCVLVFTLQKPFTHDFAAFPQAALESRLSLDFSLHLGS